MGAKIRPSTPVKVKMGAKTTMIITVEKMTANATMTEVS